MFVFFELGREREGRGSIEDGRVLRGGGEIKNTRTLAFFLAILKLTFIAVAIRSKVFPYTPKKDPHQTPSKMIINVFIHKKLKDFTQEREGFVCFF